ncbi:MAG: hypothetical protein IIZ92_22170 [Aquincola sp.]|nr:hypothetical protein [Aquincola sp.]
MALPAFWRQARLHRGLLVLAVAACLVAAASFGLAAWWRGGPSVPTHLTLLVPDGLSEDDVRVRAWRDAAEETGFPLVVRPASSLLRPLAGEAAAALIVPDSVHRQMNDALVDALQAQVEAGAALMLVHDAGIADLDGHYHPGQSRLSALAGVRYGLYGQLREHMLREQEAWMDTVAVPLLRLPPGKLMREDLKSPLTSAQPAPVDGEELAVSSYAYGRLRYPVFVTEGRFEGRRLMHGEGSTVLAGVHTAGRGQVLFVNLPLTYLKLRTDGFFMHSFLRYFAQELVGLPQLAAMPDARGALVMNWHIDSARAEPAMEKLGALGAFEQGPYSMHLTAGPDVDVPGDGGGIDLAHNPAMQAWVKRFIERGDEVGSHGGWIHNGFGRLVETQSVQASVELIERNSAVVQQASGRTVREYSAPTGTHPAWVTPWLRAHGIHAYYFTGDIGMPPTRSYQDGQRSPPDMWAFPVLSYGPYAAFEEASAAGIPQDDVAAWLVDVADYCAQQRTVRLVYFHPPGIAIFPDAFSRWLRHTRRLVDAGQLRWTTMAAHAEFANQRLAVDWQVAAEGGAALRLTARHAQSLHHMSWLLPAGRYGQPALLAGDAEIVREGPQWRITARDVTRLDLRLPVLAAAP